MIIGGGSVCSYPGNGSVAAFRNKTGWNASWIFIVNSKFSRKAWPTFFLVVNSPRFLSSSFFNGRELRMFFDERKTISPGL